MICILYHAVVEMNTNARPATFTKSMEERWWSFTSVEWSQDNKERTTLDDKTPEMIQ